MNDFFEAAINWVMFTLAVWFTIKVYDLILVTLEARRVM
jgi:hypothetical protein